MKIKSFYFLVIFVTSLILSKDIFAIDSESNNYIDINFNLTDYKIEKVDGLDRLILDKGKQNFNQSDHKMSTFIRLASDSNYDIEFNVRSEKLYNFEFKDNQILNQNSRYSIDDHIFRGVRLLEITVHPFSKNDN